MSFMANECMIGSGYFGTVYKARYDGKTVYKDGGIQIAVKVIDKFVTSSSLDDDRLQEINVMSELNHHNIVKYWFADIIENSEGIKQLCIGMEFCNGNNLKEKIELRKQTNYLFTNGQIMAWFRGASRGLQYLHQNNVIHRDIKPDNLMLHNGNVKIGDFGHAVLIKSDRDYDTPTRGAPLYACPEMYFHRFCHHKGDIWSLGVTFYELTSLRLPFRSTSDLIRYRNRRFFLKPIPDYYFDVVSNLIYKMLQYRACYRPRACSIVSELH